MKQMIEVHCKGAFRSYKIFRRSGEVVLHTVQKFQEWNFQEDRVLIVTLHQEQRKKTICETDQWTFEFQNRRHYIQINYPSLRYEILSVNHTGLVLADGDSGDKTFFARPAVWESLIKRGLSVF